MNVVWTETAISHLQSTYNHISQNSTVYATQVVDRLTERSQQIGAFPNSGRMVPEFQAESIREVIERPYRIIYRIKPDQIDVLAVLHGAQLL
jgi:toxin ParE1/3/4